MGNPLFDDLDEMFKGVTPQQTKSEENITAQPVDVTAPDFSQPIAPTQGAVSKAQAKLKMMEQELNLLFVERDEVIKNLMMALVTGQSMLLLGMPGTARVDIAA